MSDMRRAVKDSVFTYLFRQPEYTRQLYLALHPEDEDVTEEELKLITLEPVLTTGLYNDLGFQVRDKILLLIEAQSTFSKNLALRVFMYLSESYREYVQEHDLDLYSGTPITIPRPELYVVYTGDRKNVPETLRLSDLYEGAGSAEVEIKVLCSEDSGDIISQYVRFCKISDENVKRCGLTRKALDATINQCIREGVLAPFLETRRKEVTDIMVTLFSHEEIMRMHDHSIRKEGIQKGADKRDQLYNELISRLIPLGRIDDILAATSDKAKLAALAEEFGLEI